MVAIPEVIVRAGLSPRARMRKYYHVLASRIAETAGPRGVVAGLLCALRSSNAKPRQRIDWIAVSGTADINSRGNLASAAELASGTGDPERDDRRRCRRLPFPQKSRRVETRRSDGVRRRGGHVRRREQSVINPDADADEAWLRLQKDSGRRRRFPCPAAPTGVQVVRRGA